MVSNDESDEVFVAAATPATFLEMAAVESSTEDEINLAADNLVKLVVDE